MNDLLITLFGSAASLVIVALIAWAIADAATFALYISQPLLHGFQRVFLGIDKVRSGPETLIGQSAVIKKSFHPTAGDDVREGLVSIDGEVWRARSVAPEQSLLSGQRVIIESREELTLVVVPSGESTSI